MPVASRDRTARVAVLGSSVRRSRNDRFPSRGKSTLVRRGILTALILVALALLTISFRSPTSGALHDVQGYGASALRPFQVAAQRVARPFEDVYGYFSGLANAKSENKKLKRELQEWQAIANAACVTKPPGSESATPDASPSRSGRRQESSNPTPPIRLFIGIRSCGVSPEGTVAEE